jgi:hypothetical protein
VILVRCSQQKQAGVGRQYGGSNRDSRAEGARDMMHQVPIPCTLYLSLYPSPGRSCEPDTASESLHIPDHHV